LGCGRAGAPTARDPSGGADRRGSSARRRADLELDRRRRAPGSQREPGRRRARGGRGGSAERPSRGSLRRGRAESGNGRWLRGRTARRHVPDRRSGVLPPRDHHGRPRCGGRASIRRRKRRSRSHVPGDRAAMIPWLVWACTTGRPVRLEQRSASLALEGDAISRVEIRSPAGVPVLVRTFPRALDHVDIPVAWSRGGTWAVRTRSAAGDTNDEIQVTEPAGSLVEIEAPLGTERIPVEDGARLGVVVPPGSGQMIVSTTGLRPGAVAITVDGRRVVDRALGTLERASAVVPLGGHVEVRTPDRFVAFDVEPTEADPKDLARSLQMGAVSFPADRTGRPEIGRPPGRVTLAAGWWQRLLARLGLGARARDPYAEWTHVTVPLENHGNAPLSLLVETKVFLKGDGVDPAFEAPALGWNERQDGSRVLIRVPAGSDATAIVPLYVDDALLRAETARERTLEVTVTGLGSSTPLATRSVPLAVRTGNAFASLGLVVSIVGAVLGNGLVALRLGRWLRTFPTGELMTTALFATLGFGLGTV